MGKGNNTACDQNLAMSSLLEEKPVKAVKQDFTLIHGAALLNMANDPKEMAAIAAANAGMIEAQKIQTTAYQEGLETQARINDAFSLSEAQQVFDKFDANRRLPSLISVEERKIMLDKYDQRDRSDSPASRAVKERQSWPEGIRTMAENVRVERVPPGNSSSSERRPLIALLQSEDFIEVNKNLLVQHIYQKKESPTATAAEDMIKESVAGLGHTKPDPEKPVSFHWENPDQKNKRYFIQLYPSYSKIDPFDIIIDMEDVTTGEREEHRISVKAPKDASRHSHTLQEAARLGPRQKQSINIDFHNITSDEIRDPEKWLDRRAAELLGGGEIFWAGSVEDTVGKAPVRTWTSLRVLDPAVRQAVVLARHAKVPGQSNPGIKSQFVLNKDGDRGKFSWKIPVIVEGHQDQYATFVHPIYYEATNSGAPAKRNGQPVPATHSIKSGGSLKATPQLSPEVTTFEVAWSRG